MNTWQTREELLDLLCSLVNHQSITGSNAEIALPEYIHHLLAQKDYFQTHPQHLNLHPLEDGRHLLTALVRGGKATTEETVILLSHFDVVGIEDYGSLRNLAFHPIELTRELNQREDELPQEVARDLEKGNWLFGRGTMDMKAGLALHLSKLEQAMEGTFHGNILLVTVPDEEVNSKGMIAALPVLEKIKEEENLYYNACLNGEPIFQKYPEDPNYYIYTGSIGKVLPGFYCHGKETHAGEPFSGLNPNLMTSFLTNHIELNQSFIEVSGQEVTPPPVSLMQRDLKEEYSVQTPQAAISMYNILYFNQSFDELNDKLKQGAKMAANDVEAYIYEKAKQFSETAGQFPLPNPKVNVMMYEELYQEAVNQYGKEEITRRQNLLVEQRNAGDRDFSTLLVQDLASICKDLAPMIVLFYSPPFYPAVSSFDDPFIKDVVNNMKSFTKESYGIDVTITAFFTGLSDLSFVGPVSSRSKLSRLTMNMPLQKNGFTFPEETMEKLNIPVVNIGPLGKDAHQWTERLELTYSFEQLPIILNEAIHRLLQPNLNK
ncbi:MAG TPA: M20/M25/M40 family metallo-hydrolase [Virgibacillus sp.]|nr:M20/M25/M40 family metallo-hydrolase [Virgibacillus sp.]